VRNLYLHIGNNVLIKKDGVIGMFNIDKLLEDIKGKKFYNEVRQRPNVQDISGGKRKSVILTDDAVYISRISTATLLARSHVSVQDMLSAGQPGVSVSTEEEEDH
jgi:extracellular matrix regulatory protein B